MALNTRHRQVRTGQRKACLAVARQREMCRLKLGHTMALFAAILIGCPGKLTFVNVLVATAALRLRNTKYGVLALWNVALVAFHFGMSALEWVAGGGVFLDSKRGGLEPIHRVASSAIPAASARQELTFVVIGMAIRALPVCYRRLEIALIVTVAASYAAVLSDQRISGLRMIESLKLCHLRPFRCVVARLACPFETAFVRIAMAGGASGEGEPSILDVRFEISR